MLNELYTFAEPVQVVPFSSLKWGKFTLLHTTCNDVEPNYRKTSSKCRIILCQILQPFDIFHICITSEIYLYVVK